MSLDRVTRIAIDNLACFGALELVPGDSTLLLGANGAGKSTLFDILFHLQALVNQGEAPEGSFPDFQVSAGNAHVELQVSTRRGEFHYQLELLHHPTGFRELTLGPLGPDWAIAREELRLNGVALASFSNGTFSGVNVDGAIPLAEDRSPLSTVRFPEKSDVAAFKAWAEGIWLLRLEPRRMVASAEEPSDGLAVSGENFVSWLMGFSRKKEQLSRVVASIGSSIKGLRELTLERAGRDRVLVAHFEGGAKVDFDQLSDGQRCLIVLHAVLVLAKRFCTLLLLDEPDAHVTPTEILPLFSALRERVEEAGIQVMVASHHPQVIDLMASDSPWELVLRDGQASAEPFLVDRSKGVSASRHLLLRGRR